MLVRVLSSMMEQDLTDGQEHQTAIVSRIVPCVNAFEILVKQEVIRPSVIMQQVELSISIRLVKEETRSMVGM